MRLSIIYNVFIRDFRKQKKRITLTVLALGWGTVSIMLLLGFGEGLHRQMTINSKGLGEGIAIMWGGQTSIPYKGMGKGRPIHLFADDVPYLKERIPEIKEIGGQYDRWGVKLRYGENIVSEHVVGVPPNFEQMRNFIPEMGGRMINKLDVKLRRRVAFLGNDLKERLFGDEEAVGKQILVNSMPFTVIGVMKEKLQNMSYSGMDEDLLAIPHTTFVAIFGDPWLNEIIYQLRNLEDNELVERRVFEEMGARYKFDPDDDRALGIWDTVASSREFDNIMFGITIFMAIIGGLTLLIAGVGVANIMYVSIKERTREIGIKMAVGARRSYILIQFLLEALLITFFGGAGGMAVSYVLTEGFKRVPIESDVLNFLGRPTLSFEIGLIVVVILSVMGILSGLFPAMKAASVNPVESLRYE
ncbi:MAG: FtsX-like permease family protein [Candidatus Zixiibacteriota bacterium]|nr:MAG: FtsX-like permease family protein [candidate division Zixibacteria bacterium]